LDVPVYRPGKESNLERPLGWDLVEIGNDGFDSRIPGSGHQMPIDRYDSSSPKSQKVMG
jgi:hypothetical protein